MKCPSCKKDIDKSIFSPDLTFCPYCGEKLENVNMAAKLQFCPYCGQKLTAHSNFCPNCGKKLALTGKRADGEGLVKGYIEETAKTVEEKVKNVTKAIRNSFGRERRIRKLYQQWSEFSNLPPEEIPSLEDLKKISTEKDTGEDNRSNEEDED